MPLLNILKLVPSAISHRNSILLQICYFLTMVIDSICIYSFLSGCDSVKLRLLVTEGSDILYTSSLYQSLSFMHSSANSFSPMCIRSQCDVFAAKFFKSPQHILSPRSRLLPRCRIHLHCHTIGNEIFKNTVESIESMLTTYRSVLVRCVLCHEIIVSESVHPWTGLNNPCNGFQIFPVGFLLRLSFIKNISPDINPIYRMNRADYKIKFYITQRTTRHLGTDFITQANLHTLLYFYIRKFFS